MLNRIASIEAIESVRWHVPIKQQRWSIFYMHHPASIGLHHCVICAIVKTYTTPGYGDPGPRRLVPYLGYEVEDVPNMKFERCWRGQDEYTSYPKL